MTTQDLITDNAIDIVFKNRNFGSIPHREVVEINLLNVKKGYSIGYTAKRCLIELGLIREVSRDCSRITAIGDKYLDIIETSGRDQKLTNLKKELLVVKYAVIILETKHDIMKDKINELTEKEQLITQRIDELTKQNE